MSGLLKNMMNKFIKGLTLNNSYVNTFKFEKMWYGNAGKPISEKHLVTLLQERFPSAADIKVNDVSGGCGAMFEIFVASSEFKGLSIVKQHKAITETLKEEIKLIHGLRIDTKVVT